MAGGSRVLLVFAALAVLSVLLALLVRSGPDQPRRGAASAAQGGTHEQGSAALVSVTESADARPSREVRAEAPPTSPEGVGANVAAPRAPSRPFVGALVVRVLDERSEPVAGASVELLSSLGLGIVGRIEEHERAAREGWWPKTHPPDTFADSQERRGASRAITGADGRAHLVHSVTGTVIARATRDGAEHAGRVALTPMNTRAGQELDVVLVRVDAFDARVVDASGAPAGGVVVALMGRRSAPTEFAFATTDADGEVRLVDERRWRAPDSWLRALVLGGGVDAPLPPAGERALLRLPPTGEVTIELPRGVEGGSIVLQHGNEALHTRASGGAAHFGRVALGLELSARSSGAFAASTAPFQGPVNEGERVVQRLPEPGVELRLVDPDGTPLAERAILVHWVTVQPIRPPAAGILTWTDAEGALRLSPLSVSCVLSARAPDAAGRARRISATIQVPWRGTPLESPHDLGAVTLLELPLIAAGRVVDPEGRGIERAIVYAAPAPLPRPESAGGHAFGVATGADGSFVLEGELADASDVFLFAWARGYVDSRAVAFASGAEDHEIVLAPGAHLVATVAFDTGSRHAAMRTWIEGPGGVLDAVRPEHGPAERRYLFEDIAPGEWTLRIAPSGGGEFLYERTARLVAGERFDFGRIDLTQALELVIVRVFDAVGEPARNFRWRVPGEDGEGRWFNADRDMRVPRTARDERVEVRANGHYDGSAALEGRVVEIRLRRAPPVRLRLPPGYPPPRPGRAVTVAFTRDPADVFARYVFQDLTDERFEVELTGAGRYRAEVHVAGTRHQGLTVEFDVSEADLEARREIELPFDPDVWRALVDVRDAPRLPR